MDQEEVKLEEVTEIEYYVLAYRTGPSGRWYFGTVRESEQDAASFPTLHPTDERKLLKFKMPV